MYKGSFRNSKKMLKSVSLMQNKIFCTKRTKQKSTITSHKLSHDKIHLTKCSEMITPQKKTNKLVFHGLFCNLQKNKKNYHSDQTYEKEKYCF